MIKCPIQVKIFSTNIQKQRKVPRRRGIFLKYGIFSIFKSRRVHFLYESPTPLVKLGGLTWKGAPLISKFSKPLHLWDPEAQPSPFQREEGVGVRAMPMCHAICLRFWALVLIMKINYIYLNLPLSRTIPSKLYPLKF